MRTSLAEPLNPVVSESFADTAQAANGIVPVSVAPAVVETMFPSAER